MEANSSHSSWTSDKLLHVDAFECVPRHLQIFTPFRILSFATRYLELCPRVILPKKTVVMSNRMLHGWSTVAGLIFHLYFVFFVGYLLFSFWGYRRRWHREMLSSARMNAHASKPSSSSSLERQRTGSAGACRKRFRYHICVCWRTWSSRNDGNDVVTIS